MTTEIKLDGLVQQWASQQRSAISGKPATCGHHLIGRRYKLLRHDLNNILPVTHEEHMEIHKGNISDKRFITEYLINQSNIDYKSYLLSNGFLEKDFWAMCEDRIRREL